jgi:hypothetical protein
MTQFDDTVLRAALEPARNLEPTDGELARVLARARGKRPASMQRALVLAFAIAALLTGGAYTVPATRAAVDDLTGSFAGWVGSDDDQAPGRVLRPGDDAPPWLRDTGARVIAERDGVRLYVTRIETQDQGTMLGFALGNNGFATWDSVEGWRDQFEQHAVAVLGPAPLSNGTRCNEDGQFPLLGLSGGSVDRVELGYTTGPPSQAAGLNGGFVLMADGRRPLREIVAYDSTGRILDRASVSNIDMRDQCQA